MPQMSIEGFDSTGSIIIDESLEEGLNGLVELATQICDSPHAMISLFNDRHQVATACKGWNPGDVPNEESFSFHTLQKGELVLIPDTTDDERFSNNRFVKDEPGIRFYAGVPLHTEAIQNLGVLSVSDTRPRRLSDAQINSLYLLANEAISRLGLAETKQKLEKQNRQLKQTETFLNNSSDIQLIIDPDTLYILEINEEALFMLGGDKEDYLNKPFGKHIPDDEMQERIINFLKNNEASSQQFVSPVKNSEGTKIILEKNFTLKNNKWYMSGRDITEKHRARKELEHILTNMSIGQDLAQLGTWRWTLGTDELEWSDKAHEIYGAEKMESSVDLFEKRIHPDDREPIIAAMQKIKSGKRDRMPDFEHRLIMPDKSIKWVRYTGRILYSNTGVPEEVIGAVQDVTEQKEAQKKLEEEKELSDAIINSLPILFFMFDEEGKIIRWNKKVQDVLGYSEVEMGQNKPLDYFEEDSQQLVQSKLQKVFAEGYATLEAPLLSKDGTKTPYLFSASRFRRGDQHFMLGTGLNITRHKEYEQEIQASLREKEVLLAEVHHRVKNNLAVISGLLELEAYQSDSDKAKSQLMDSQNRLQSIAKIHELLYESNNFSTVNLGEEISELTDNISATYAARNDISIDLEVACIELNVNQAIPLALIINELVTNIYKHGFSSDDEGVIKINVEEKGRFIHLNIIDNGEGLPENFDSNDPDSVGLKIISVLTKQLNGTLDYKTLDEGGMQVALEFEKDEDKSGSASNIVDQ